ncbi:unnamed protein product [Durusdinium trenchii]|uniref:Uncharacterized protein n=1 Tax=Durusdinium trenchii TaxID=1381693 RepID=A0ABP0K0X5_9DINO
MEPVAVEPMARVGLDLNQDGQADVYVEGVDRNRDGIPDILQQATTCECGNIFAADARFCRKCGKPRPLPKAVHLDVPPTVPQAYQGAPVTMPTPMPLTSQHFAPQVSTFAATPPSPARVPTYSAAPQPGPPVTTYTTAPQPILQPVTTYVSPQPVIQEVVREVPVKKRELRTIYRERPQVEFVQKTVDVPKVEVKERLVEVPQVLLHERIMEVPEIFEDELVKQVPRVEYLEVEKPIELPIFEAREQIQELPFLLEQECLVEVPQVQCIELIREVSKEVVKKVQKLVERPVVKVVEQPVEVPVTTVKEELVEVPVLEQVDIIKQVPIYELKQVEKQVEVPAVELQERIIEVPQTEVAENPVEIPDVEICEVIRQVPKYEVQYIDKEVVRHEIRYIEKLIEVPHVIYEERIIEVPQVERRELIRHVPVTRVQVVDKKVPRHTLEVTEKIVEVPTVLTEEFPVEEAEIAVVETITEVPKIQTIPVPVEVPKVVNVQIQERLEEVYSTLIEERVLEVLQQCCTLVEGISVFALFTITTECAATAFNIVEASAQVCAFWRQNREEKTEVLKGCRVYELLTEEVGEERQGKMDQSEATHTTLWQRAGCEQERFIPLACILELLPQGVTCCRIFVIRCQNLWESQALTAQLIGILIFEKLGLSIDYVHAEDEKPTPCMPLQDVLAGGNPTNPALQTGLWGLQCPLHCHPASFSSLALSWLLGLLLGFLISSAFWIWLLIPEEVGGLPGCMSSESSELGSLVKAIEELTIAVRSRGQSSAAAASSPRSNWELVEEEVKDGTKADSKDEAEPVTQKEPDFFAGIPFGDYDTLARSLVPCPWQLIESCKALHGGKYPKEYRARRAWEAGQWAKLVLTGHVAKPKPSWDIDLSPAVYVVLRAPGISTPTRVGTYAELHRTENVVEEGGTTPVLFTWDHGGGVGVEPGKISAFAFVMMRRPGGMLLALPAAAVEEEVLDRHMTISTGLYDQVQNWLKADQSERAAFYTATEEEGSPTAPLAEVAKAMGPPPKTRALGAPKQPPTKAQRLHPEDDPGDLDGDPLTPIDSPLAAALLEQSKALAKPKKKPWHQKQAGTEGRSGTGPSFQPYDGKGYEFKPVKGPELVKDEISTLSFSFQTWCMSLTRWVLSAKTAFSKYLASTLRLCRDGPQSSPTALFPLPLPSFAPYAAWVPGGPRRKKRDLAINRALHVLVCALNYVYMASSFPPLDLIRRQPNKVQSQALENLRLLLQACDQDKPIHVESSGRKNLLLLSRLQELAQAVDALGLSSSPYHTGRQGLSVPADNTKHPKLSPFGSLQSDRLKISGCGQWNAVSYMPPEFQMGYLEPQLLELDAPVYTRGKPNLENESPQEVLKLFKRWDSFGLLALHPASHLPEGPEKKVKIFNAYKSEEWDRQIGDRRLQNAYEARLPGPSKDLPCGPLITRLILPEGHGVKVCVTDRSDFYHQMAATYERSRTNAVWPPLKLGELQGTQAYDDYMARAAQAKKPPDRTVHGDLLNGIRPWKFETEPDSQIFGSFQSVLQGDHLGVEFGIASHVGFLQEQGLLLGRGRLQTSSLVRPTGLYEGLVIDDYFTIAPVPLQELRSKKVKPSKAHQAFITAKQAYAQAGLAGSDAKDVVDQSLATVVGAELDSRPSGVQSGTLPVGAPALSLSWVALQAARFAYTTDALHSSMMGALVSACCFRKCTMAIFQELFKVISPQDLDTDHPKLRVLPRKASDELVLAGVLLPVMASNIMAQVSTTIFCSDASMGKGAFCEAQVDKRVAEALWQSGDFKGGHVILDTMPKSILRSHAGVEVEDWEREEEDSPFLGHCEAEPTAERPLAQFYDFLEVCGGSGVISDAMSKKGYVVGPIIDLTYSIHYDLTKSRTVEWLLFLVQNGRVRSLALEPPCTTFSAAAHPMVRSYRCPRGFNQKASKVWLGNRIPQDQPFIMDFLDLDGLYSLAEMPRLRRWASNWAGLVLGLLSRARELPLDFLSPSYRLRSSSLPLTLHEVLRDFDSTKGYPGEGPHGTVVFVAFLAIGAVVAAMEHELLLEPRHMADQARAELRATRPLEYGRPVLDVTRSSREKLLRVFATWLEKRGFVLEDLLRDAPKDPSLLVRLLTEYGNGEDETLRSLPPAVQHLALLFQRSVGPEEREEDGRRRPTKVARVERHNSKARGEKRREWLNIAMTAASTFSSHTRPPGYPFGRQRSPELRDTTAKQEERKGATPAVERKPERRSKSRRQKRGRASREKPDSRRSERERRRGKHSRERPSLPKGKRPSSSAPGSLQEWSMG